MAFQPPEIRFRRHPFLYLLPPLATGIWIERIFLPKNSGWIWSFLIISTLVFFAGSIFRERLRPALFRWIPIISCFFFVGMLTAFVDRENTFVQKEDEVFLKGNGLTGKILETPEVKPKTIKLLVEIDAIRLEEEWHFTGRKVFVYLFRKEEIPNIHKGQRIYFPNQLSLITNRGNPFEFDYAGYLGRRGIFYQCFLDPKLVYFPNSEDLKPGFIDRLRGQLLRTIEKNIKDTATAALTEATLLNDRDLLNNDIRKAYSATGIAHIIAISGMHVSLFFSIILGLLIWIKPPGLRWIKYLFGLPVIWLYVTLTNFPPSAVRAATMFSFVLVGLTLRRKILPLNFLMTTGFILLFFKPTWLFDTGVQLSFAAVASILLFYRSISALIRPESRILKWLWDGLSVSLSAQILVFPLILYYFHQFPVWFLLANIPASLYSLLLMTMALLLFVLDAIGIPCLWLGGLMEILTTNFHRIIFFLSKHTPLTFLHLTITQVQFWVLMIAVLLFCLFIFFRRGIWILSGLLACCLLVGDFIFQDFKASRQRRIVVYNVNGNGLVDYFEGRKAFLTGSKMDSIPNALIQYNLLPARLGYHMKDPLARQVTEGLKIVNGKKVLVVDEHINPIRGDSFPVDYLILNKNAKMKAVDLQTVFQPKLIILDGSYNRWMAERFQSECEDVGIPVHYVVSDGAWIYPKD